MTNKNITKNFYYIFNLFIKYLPSRILVVLNSLIIIPFFAYILSENEMGLYQLTIGALNLLCTCSTDWITKSTLRFYEKYKLQEKLPEFYSNIILISAIIYLATILFYLLFADFISTNFFIPKSLLTMTIILIIPCGLRQFLYQMLRVLNKPFLYTFSIIIYQISHLLLFLALFKFLENVIAILASMSIAMFIIDIYIIKQIQLKSTLKFSFDKKLIKESLQYSLPTIITNTGLWFLFHVNKFLFQKLSMFSNTAIVGIAWTYTTYIMTPILSTFLFAIFPIIIKKYEHQKDIKQILTKTIQLYCIMFIPLVSIFIFYSNEIIQSMFDEKYSQASIIIPFFALTIFLHELMKILNIKYHLKNRTYIEMLITVLVGLICLYLNYTLIPVYKLWGAGIAMLSSIILLITLHSLVHFKNIATIQISKTLKTVTFTVFCGIIIFTIIHFSLQNLLPNKIAILKPILFISIYYSTLWNLKNKILA